MRQRDAAICLRTVDYSDTSQVVHFLTPAGGLVRLLAKGTKRPKSKSGGMIDIFQQGQLVFIPSAREGLGTLVEFTESVSHNALRRDQARLSVGLYMIELSGEMLPEGEANPAAFELLRKSLLRLGQADASPAAVLAYFQWRLLRHVGLLGEFDACVSCGREAKGDRSRRASHFSSSCGGLLCPDCQGAATEKFCLDGPTLGGLAALAAAEAGRRVSLPDRQADGVNRLLAYHIAYQLGKPLKTARYVIRR